MTFSTLNIIYGLEIVQARGMWFLLPNISSSFARFSLYFMVTFFWLFTIGWTSLEQTASRRAPNLLSKRRLSGLPKVKKMTLV